MISGTQTPLGINALGSVLQNIGLNINTAVQDYVGISKTNTDYSPGKLVTGTVLNTLTYGIHRAYYNLPSMSTVTYNNLIAIGANTIPALGNSLPPTYVISDPSNHWTGQATTGYYIAGNTGQGQSATWLPYDTTNANKSVTQWGYFRLFALQAWNEFNWNGIPDGVGMPSYKDFTLSFLVAKGFVDSTNSSIISAKNSPTFAEGTFSSMDDLVTADLTGVTKALPAFGQDCIAAGRSIDLTKMSSFGLPSVLLQTIRNNNTLTASLALALISSGLTSNEIETISKNVGNTTIKQEQQIYGAFLIIVGQDLLDILIPLNCKTQGLTSLADLLNIKKLFPKSYPSLTVPLYNLQPDAVSSKKYNLIFINGGVNPAINTPAVQAQIGPMIPPNAPVPGGITSEIQVLKEGYGSYLIGILPQDIAVSSGAFSYSMQQVKNIQFAEFEKFAQVVASLETLKGLDLINTASSVDPSLASQASQNIALGSGPDGTFTGSDFFGCMSGLPYLWNNIYTSIRNLQTTTLENIYQELSLAASWRQAVITMEYSEAAGPIYTVTGVTLTDPGGGYGRNGAPAPSITVDSGAVVTCTIGTDPTDPATYGCVTSVTLVSAGPTSATPPIATVQCPPTTGSVNTPSGTVGWPTMDVITQGFIDDANAEIAAIKTANPGLANILNATYNTTGAQLTIEQRARFIGIYAVPSPTRDTSVSTSPSQLVSFVDTIPEIAKSTEPHMFAQTLEAISDITTIGGQSMIGMMREARNQARLDLIGVPLDDNIDAAVPTSDATVLIANGTLNSAVNGGVNGYTQPSNYPAAKPAGYFNTESKTYNITADISNPDQISPLADIFATEEDCPCVGESVKAGARQATSEGAPVDIGHAYPGSLGGSPYTNLIPPNLNGLYISATMSSSTYTVDEAVSNATSPN